MSFVLLFLALITLLFPSCTPDNTIKNRDIYLISVADDFAAYNEGNSKLDNVINDQAALISQISTFDNVHVYAYVSQNGKRYVSIPTEENPSKTPRFSPADSSNAILDSPSDDTFDHFEYVPAAGESEADWTIDTVLSEVEGLHTSEDDVIIFTYSGHGDENSGALITNGDRNPYVKTNRERIIEVFLSLSGNKIFFLDSCYSGYFISETTLNTLDTFTTDEDHYEGEDYVGGIKNSSLVRTSDSQPSLWIMASAGRRQTASDSSSTGDSLFQKHFGAFTCYLLKALGYNMDKNESEKKSSPLTFYSVYSYIRASFPELSIQTPRTSLKRLDIRLR